MNNSLNWNDFPWIWRGCKESSLYSDLVLALVIAWMLFPVQECSVRRGRWGDLPQSAAGHSQSAQHTHQARHGKGQHWRTQQGGLQGKTHVHSRVRVYRGTSYTNERVTIMCWLIAIRAMVGMVGATKKYLRLRPCKSYCLSQDWSHLWQSTYIWKSLNISGRKPDTK